MKNANNNFNSYESMDTEIINSLPAEQKQLKEVIEQTELNLNNLRNDVLYTSASPKAKIFYENNPKFLTFEHRDAVAFAVEQKISFEEISNILLGEYNFLNDLPEDRREEVLSIIQQMKEGAMLDHVDTSSLEEFFYEEWVDYPDSFWSDLEKLEATSVFEENRNVNEGIEENPEIQKMIEIATKEIGNNENDGSADKYFRDLGFKTTARKTPWCAAFVNWVLKQAGLPGTKNNLAKSFIGRSDGYGHVGIKVAENKMINGNWDNRVGYSPLPKTIIGYSIPTKDGLKIFKWNFKDSEIPLGALVVKERNPKSRRGRRET